MQVHAPLDVLPLYVRENAVIPMGPPMRHVEEKPVSPLTLDCYPASEGMWTCQWVEGKKKADIALRVDAGQVTLTLRNMAVDTVLRVHHLKTPLQAGWNGVPAEGHWEEAVWVFAPGYVEDGLLTLRCGGEK